MPLGRARRRPLPPAAPSALTAEPWPLWSPKRRREWPPREHSRCEDPARPGSWGEGTPARNRDPGCQETYLAEQVGGRPGGARGHGRRREKPTAPSPIAEGRRLGHSPRGHVQVLLDLSVLRLCTCICVFDVTTSGSVYAKRKKNNHHRSALRGRPRVWAVRSLVWDFHYPEGRRAVGAAGTLHRALESARSTEKPPSRGGGSRPPHSVAASSCPGARAKHAALPPLRLGHQQTPQSPVPTEPFNVGELGLHFLPAPNVLYCVTDGQSQAAS